MARTITLKNGNKLKLPDGVEVRGNTVRIRVPYPDGPQYEVIARTVNTQTLKAAAAKKALLASLDKHSIKWLEHFPNSPHARKVAGLEDDNLFITFGEALAQCYEVFKSESAPSSLKGHTQAMKDMLAHFGKDTPLKDLTLKQCEAYRDEQAKTRQAKTVNSRLTLLRRVLEFGQKEELFQTQITSKFKGLKAPAKAEELLTEAEKHSEAVEKFEPLTVEELKALSSIKEERLQPALNVAMFSCWTGLSVSEALALAWEDIETTKGVSFAYIRRSEVEGTLKVTKTRSRARTIELNERALSFLNAQKQHSYLMPKKDYEILARDNSTLNVKKLRFVFLNPHTQQRWQYESYRRHWKRICKLAQVPYRSPNKARHTFASRMLTGGLDLHRLIAIMGHSDEKMLRQHYATWMHKDDIGRSASIQNSIISNLGAV